MGNFEWKELNRFDQRRLYAFRRIYWIEKKGEVTRSSLLKYPRWLPPQKKRRTVRDQRLGDQPEPLVG